MCLCAWFMLLFQCHILSLFKFCCTESKVLDVVSKTLVLESCLVRPSPVKALHECICYSGEVYHLQPSHTAFYLTSFLQVSTPSPSNNVNIVLFSMLINKCYFHFSYWIIHRLVSLRWVFRNLSHHLLIHLLTKNCFRYDFPLKP